jgi:hypothetical protein
VITGKGFEHFQSRARPAPRRHPRQAMSKAVSPPATGMEGNAVVMALGVVTCIAAFLAVYGGWSF